MTLLEEVVGRVQADPSLATRAIQALYRAEPDPLDLIGKEEFTLRELQHLHEQLLGPLQRATFRHYMSRRLVPTGVKTVGNIGKPAEYFRKKEN